MHWRIFYSIIVFLCFTTSVHAEPQGTPMSAVQDSVGKILDIINGKDYKDPSKKELLKNMIFHIANESFSWEDMAKRSLGRKWNDQDEVSQKRFVDLFARLLKVNYLDKLETYTGEEVIYEKEDIKGKYAEVRTQIVRGTREKIPVYYRMITKNGSWYVYDVVIEGISLVKNYNSQFDEMLSGSSFTEFLQTLEKKVEEKQKQP